MQTPATQFGTRRDCRRGINRDWLDALAFGPTVSLGWNAVARQVNDKGQVEGTCVRSGMGWDPMFYMYRPVHVLAARLWSGASGWRGNDRAAEDTWRQRQHS